MSERMRAMNVTESIACTSVACAATATGGSLPECTGTSWPQAAAKIRSTLVTSVRRIAQYTLPRPDSATSGIVFHGL
jgi:hypothetical protein